MTPNEFAEDYPGFPVESISEVLKFAAQRLNKSIPDTDDDLAA
jgi:uncharacterized protein (DUF433 family)